MTNGEKFKEVFGFGADGSRVIAVNAIWWDCEFQNSKPITKRVSVADVRPVVRCKDCKYWKQWDSTTHYLCTYVDGAKFIRNADDFCSRGEKEES